MGLKDKVVGTVVIKPTKPLENFPIIIDEERSARPVCEEPMLAVLHVDDTGEWAVYVGKETDGVEYVHKHGEKVPADMARFLFPNWTGHYRV